MKQYHRLIRTGIQAALFILFIQTESIGQQLPLYSQYSLNSFLLNPAAAGAEGFTTLNLMAREQWVGFKGTPKIHSLSIDSRILRKSFISKDESVRKRKRLNSRSGRVGWGAHIFNDHNSLIDRTGIEGTYSYHIPLGPGQLSMGLTGTLYQTRLAEDKVILSDDVPDYLITGSRNSFFIPDASVGVFYNQKGLFGGFSIAQLFQSSLQFGNAGSGDYKLKRHYYIMAGYRDYSISDNFLLSPTTLLKFPEGNAAQMDIQAKLTYMDNYWAGLGYRTSNTLVFFAGLMVDKYYFGYAFDYNLSSIMKQTFGSHEIYLAIRFADSARRYKWLNEY
ncbi:MAG: type IX secretion system membrane protein PorP/SprF [Bacteroidales bacterium]|nr:type IX secretion system membrane protein PorP/SprF [Bacteroidales bacterium]